MHDQKWLDLEQDIIQCRLCPRLVAWREEVAQKKRRAFLHEEYWGKPVPGFGDTNASVLVVGLAPGAHGSNRTGRMFTGDASGDFLYGALYRTGFANQPKALHRDDGLIINRLFITAVCRCVPPKNRPDGEEKLACSPFIERELALLWQGLSGVVVLGGVAYDWMARIFSQMETDYITPKFGHGVFIPAHKKIPWMLASYHPSRQNTQTGRLTVEMFELIWLQTKDLLDAAG